MFFQLLAVALALPFVSALTLNAPTGATTGGVVTITWEAASTDPAYFTLQLVNPAFHNTYAISNNVQTSLGTITLELPQVPVDTDYQLEAIDPSNVNDVYATSSSFSIGAATSSSNTATTSTATSGATASTSTSPSTASGTVASVTTATTPASTGATTTTSSTASSTNFNGVPYKFNFAAAPVAVVVLSAIAGAAMLF
ncbi:hypothetical protein EDD16DRAFT_923084 [Pisolithus croceorrhizus]|nr:hypothetical protein EDD16DRAFT_923084 [Pisolithus croceorrhizus]KAI6161386.1 hypothetical protein EDD17DRAFT_700814 [Pisolithus thermaeus]